MNCKDISKKYEAHRLAVKEKYGQVISKLLNQQENILKELTEMEKYHVQLARLMVETPKLNTAYNKQQIDLLCKKLHY